MRRRVALALWNPGAAAILVALVCQGCGWETRQSDRADRPVERAEDGYVTSKACQACHPGPYAAWFGSYHRRMTQVATPEAVAADFDDVELEASGERYRLEQRDGTFWVEIDQGPGTSSERHRIVLTTGSHHRQWVWFATDDSPRVGTIPFIYELYDQRWIPREAAFMLAPRAGWTKSHHDGRWSASCVSCHTTHGRMRGLTRDEARLVEFGIACEACHGPAEDHARQNRNPARRYRQYMEEGGDATIVNPARLPHRRSAEVCGQCHSVSLVTARSNHERQLLESREAYRPGDDLSSLMARVDRPVPLAEAARWPDGVMRSGGREYDALVATPCFQRGEMTCTSCHVLHRKPEDPRPLPEWANDQLGMGMESDHACLQCHESTREHTHHRPESSGSRCYNCHMPRTSYALLKAIRNHGVGAPSVTSDTEAGRPNACNLCHLDKSLGWTADHLAAWYDVPRPELDADEERIAASVLWILSGHAGQRALAGWHMGWPEAREVSGTEWIVPYLIQLLDDPYPNVRIISYRSLQTVPGFEQFAYDYVGPLNERRAALARAFRAFTEASAARKRTGEPILIDADGRLQRQVYERLLAARDQRNVNWIE